MKDPGVSAACQGEPAACFCTVERDFCGTGTLGAVWRPAGSAPRSGTVVKFSCASQ